MEKKHYVKTVIHTRLIVCHPWWKVIAMMYVFKCLYLQGVMGLYRGYLVTLSRELPFALLQFPLWEYLKASI